MESIYRQMIAEAEGGQSFKSINGFNILNFPLDVPFNVDILDFLEDTFEKYYKLLDRIIEIKKRNDINVDQVHSLGDCLINVIKSVRNGKIIDAYLAFESIIDKVKDQIPVSNMENGYYYRMRDQRNIVGVSEMYPLPPKLRYKSSSERFSISGYPCFYIGQSRNVCKTEIGECGTMVRLELNNGVKFKLYDLTFTEGELNEENNELKFIRVWPLVASCYINQFYCVKRNRLCPPEMISYNENYTIPQFFTIYVRKKCDEINGIRYYTAKERNLNICGKGEEDMRNIVLFVDSSSDTSYDKFVRQFKWGNPYNV